MTYNLSHCNDVVSSSNKNTYVNEAYIENILVSELHTDVLIVSDTNFACDSKNSGYKQLLQSSNLKAVISYIWIVDSELTEVIIVSFIVL